MDITINGKPRSVAEGRTVLELLQSLEISPEAVIVEHNGRIVKCPGFGDARVAHGDRLELIQIVGGG
jgi:sulfur carrier protein